MKRIFNLFVATAMALPLFCGCEQLEIEKTPVIHIVSAPENLDAAGGDGYAIEYSVLNPLQGAAVMASADAEWITGVERSEEGRIVFFVESNDGEERTGTITLEYPKAQSVSCTMTQYAADVVVPQAVIVLNDDALPLSAAAEGDTFSVSFEVENPREGADVSAKSTVEWITDISLSDSAVSFRVETNTDTAERSGAVTLSYPSADNVSITVTQAASAVTPPPTPVGGARYAGWAELPVEVADEDYYYAYHLCPTSSVLKGKRNYTVCFSAEHHCAWWVAAPLHDSYTGSSGRSGYSSDPVIPVNLQGSGSMQSPYNRGHMLGSAERTREASINKQVFYYTNIAPQHGTTFNTGGGAWNNLEDHIDGLWHGNRDTLYVVIGCYFDSYTDAYGKKASPRSTKFGSQTVSVPTMFYYAMLRTKNGNTGKSVLNCSASELQCAAFVMSHAQDKGHEPQAKDMMSVSDLEKITGFTYFPNVPNAPKDTYNPSDWL